MYNEYFGFRETPFAIAPDARYLFMTDQHREALAHLVYGLNSEGGCILLTGEVGTGKTTVCRCLLRQVPEDANIALVLNPKVTVTELLATICDELHIDYDKAATIKDYVDLINDHLIASHSRGEKTVLIIDEAQNLEKPVLEQLRLLTNLETDQQKLLQIIILGQPELIDILSSEEMRQLAQRITARYHLKPLTRDDVKAYINHRLAIAGQNVQYFPDKVISKLYSYSKGVPRLINVLCDRALLGTYVQNRTQVDVATLDQAATEVFGEIKNVTERRKGASTGVSIAIAASLVIAALAILLFGRTSIQGTMTADELAATPVVTPDAPEAEAIAVAPVIAETVPQQDEIEAAPQTDAAVSVEPDAPSSADRLASFIDDAGDDNKSDAYVALFDIWGHEFNARIHASACKRASDVGLSCLHRQGNLGSVRQLNRPAIFKLYNQSGKHAYALVTRLTDDIAEIDTGDEIITVDRSIMDRHWLGEYSLLWQKPPYYQTALQPGANGPMVQWLDQQLVRLYGLSDDPTINDTYNDTLMAQVKRFQLSNGLIPDGVAGPATFIMLNTALGESTPQLDSARES